jgi:spermidine synthase
MRKIYKIERCRDIGNIYSDLTRLSYDRSKYNKIEIVRSPTYGKILFLNNELMDSEKDEFLYHEPLVHLPMAFIECPQTAMVFGGGDLNVVREICKYRSIRYILMIEIDRLVVTNVLSNYAEKKNIPDDRRLEIVYADAYKIIRKINKKFDLIINDAKDLTLYIKGRKKDVFETMYDSLKPEGVCADVVYRNIYERKTILKTLKALEKFKRKRFALITVPTFPGCLHILTIWGKNRNLLNDLMLPINREQRQWITRKDHMINKYYDPRYLKYFLYLPRYLKDFLFSRKNSS